MNTTPQSMSDDELPVPAFRLTWRGGAYYVSEPSICDTDCYTAEQLHAVRAQAFHDGQVAGRATAEQAGKVEVIGANGEPYPTTLVGATFKPTQPAATQMPVAEVCIHDGQKYIKWADGDYEYMPVGTRFYAAPVSPSREVEALATCLEVEARLLIACKGRSDKSSDVCVMREAAAMLRALAPVQEKAP